MQNEFLAHSIKIKYFILRIDQLLEPNEQLRMGLASAETGKKVESSPA